MSPACRFVKSNLLQNLAFFADFKAKPIYREKCGTIPEESA
jgi:hypothetical protein